MNSSIIPLSVGGGIVTNSSKSNNSKSSGERHVKYFNIELNLLINFSSLPKTFFFKYSSILSGEINLRTLYPNFPTKWWDQNLPLENNFSAIVTSMETLCESTINTVCVSKYRLAGQWPDIFFLSSDRNPNLPEGNYIHYKKKCSKEQADMLRMFIALFHRSPHEDLPQVVKIFRALSDYLTVFDNISLRIHVTKTDLNNLDIRTLSREAKEYLEGETAMDSYDEMTEEWKLNYELVCKQLIKFIVKAVSIQYGFKETVLDFFNCCAERKMMMHCMDDMNTDEFNDFAIVTKYEPCDACSIMLNEVILANGVPHIYAYSLQKYNLTRNFLVEYLESKFIMLKSIVT